MSMTTRLRKIWSTNSCRKSVGRTFVAWNVFRDKLGQFRHNILCTAKLCLFLYLWCFETPEGCWSVIFPGENQAWKWM